MIWLGSPRRSLLRRESSLITHVKPCRPYYPPANVLKISNKYVMRGVIKKTVYQKSGTSTLDPSLLHTSKYSLVKNKSYLPAAINRPLGPFLSVELWTYNYARV